MLRNQAVGCFLMTALLLPQPTSLHADVASLKIDQARVVSWDGARALRIIEDLVRFSPRAMETPGHQQAIDYIVTALKTTKFDTISLQQWTADEAGRRMAMTNIVARFNPSEPRRVIVGTHYDSIIRAYRDAKNPDAPMPGANNSASGVAVLLETARIISEASGAPPLGIDMIFFDGEEGPLSLGAGDPNYRALGSPYFVSRLADFYPAAKPEKMVNLDMVCDRDLQLKAEQSGLHSALTEVVRFWRIGMKIAPGAFKDTVAPYAIDDDHTAFASAGIPAFVVIDFDYEPFYNTTEDTPDKCSVQSLEAVGRTLLTYLYLQ